MGIDDRDYMRERYRKRQGLDPGGTTWNDRKGRLELFRFGFRKSVPLGSASWISGTSSKPSWFEKINRGHDYQRGRWRPASGKPDRTIAILLSSVMLGSTAVLGVINREWLGTHAAAIAAKWTQPAFPASGSVSVSPTLDLKRVNSRMTLQGSKNDSVVQMLDAGTGEHRLSVHIRAHERITVPAPVGRYRIHFIHGPRWAGAADLFGNETVRDEVVGIIVFTPRRGHILDLRLGSDSNLSVRRLSPPDDQHRSDPTRRREA